MGKPAQRIHRRLSLRRTFFSLTALAFVLLLPTGCREAALPPVTGLTLEGLPDVELFGATIQMTSGSRNRLILSSPHISRFERGDVMLLQDDMKADIFDRQGRHTGRLTAREGEIVERDRRLFARGNVVVANDSGMVLYADTLYYEPKTDRIRSDGFVTIITPQDSLSGWGLNAAADLSEWQIINTGGETYREMKR